MPYEFVKYEKKQNIGYITLNRPEVLNALHGASHIELAEIYNEIAEDPDVWVVIVTGAGERAFSAGNDLKATAEASRRPPSERKQNLQGAKGGFGGNTTRWDFVKPIIAAVNGWAMGGGFEIVLASDIVIAAENAQFGLPEPRVGLLAGAGGIHRLPRQLGMKRAMGMILTGKPIDAETALDWGLVNEVVPQSNLLATAERWATEIMECSPLSIRASKEAAMLGMHMSMEEVMSTRFPAQEIMGNSEDLIEGPRAFAEKRPPQWKGR